MASPEVPASLIFGKYAVLRRLAQGGMLDTAENDLNAPHFLFS